MRAGKMDVLHQQLLGGILHSFHAGRAERMPNRPWVFCALLCVLPFEVLCPAQSAPTLQENCSSVPMSFCVYCCPLLMRLCGGVSVFVIAAPLDLYPLAYAVAIRNVSKQPI